MSKKAVLSKEEVANRKRARDAVQSAIKAGKIDKGLRCLYCGNPEVEHHHINGYEKERWFDIIWVCKICHKKMHRSNVPDLRKKVSKHCMVCGKPARRLNLCETHRTRLRRYGSPFLKREKIGSDWQIVEEYFTVNIPAVENKIA